MSRLPSSSSDDEEECPQLVEDHSYSSSPSIPNTNHNSSSATPSTSPSTFPSTVPSPSPSSSPLPSSSSFPTLVPLTILSGFLGSGKSSFIHHMISTLGQTKRIAIVQNETSQSMGMENPLLMVSSSSSSSSSSSPTEPLSSLVELSNGCVCCTVRSDLLIGLDQLVSLRPFDLIFLECFPSEDTRVLTNRGFLFLDEIKTIVNSSNGTLSYACYDVKSKQLVYRSGILVEREYDGKLIDFTHHNDVRNWDECSDEYGAIGKDPNNDRGDHISLRVTPDHQMFVKRGRMSISSDGSSDGVNCQPHLSAQNPPSQVEAKELLLNRKECVSPLACAENGMGETEKFIEIIWEVCEILQLKSLSEFGEFLSLYGFWLGNGSMDMRAKYVTFCIQKPTDIQWLKSKLSSVGLEQDKQWKWYNNNDNTVSFVITAARWWNYFVGEYGEKYDEEMGTEGEEEQNGMETQNEKIKSTKWFFTWVFYALDREFLRLIIDGLRLADGSADDNELSISTSSHSFRDNLSHVLYLAGYTSHFSLMYRKGMIRGYNDNRVRGHIICPLVYDSLDKEEKVNYRALKANCDHWRVMYAQPHSTGGDEACFPTLQCNVDVKQVDYKGVKWCVTVDHGDHLIVAQRAHRNDEGKVTKASRPIIVGNCSGLAQIDSVISSLWCDENLGSKIKLDSVITVVDAKNSNLKYLGNDNNIVNNNDSPISSPIDPQVHELLMNQIAFADIVIINKIDLLSSSSSPSHSLSLSEIHKKILSINPTATLIDSTHSQVDHTMVINKNSFDFHSFHHTFQTINQKTSQITHSDKNALLCTSPDVSSYIWEPTFSSTPSSSSPPLISLSSLQSLLSSLLWDRLYALGTPKELGTLESHEKPNFLNENKENDIYRVKGILHNGEDTKHAYYLQGVRELFEIQKGGEWTPTSNDNLSVGPPRTKILIIGKHLHWQKLNDLLNQIVRK